jgi:hypothetical protein
MGEAPQRPPLVVDAVLRAHHGHVGRRHRRDRVEGGVRVLGLRAHDHHVACAEPEGRHVIGDRHLHLHRSRRRPEQEAAVTQCVVVGAAGDQHDVVPVLGQPAADGPADRPGPEDHVPHGARVRGLMEREYEASWSERVGGGGRKRA